ncbi:MAG: phosphoribosylformylglycinamidine synthase I [Elusimicrobiota bacterium]|jgi:phosphoribosylformylglycinamidine synthase|nr:phosphoribosylformylglycinamidine synthase I [Elusimicrobiota bacterium]
MGKAKVLILRTAGTNCDYETQSAFEECKAVVEKLHINAAIGEKDKILKYDILVFPGGFSYGDDIASGKILANEVKSKLGDILQKFASSKRPIIGICNGFQVLVKMGLLPDNKLFEQISTLSYNDSNKFECRWVYLKTKVSDKDKVKCLWTKNLPDIITLPIAHGEGKFIPKNKKIIDDLKKNHQIVLRYCDRDAGIPQYPLDPNGSVEQIAGICNPDGNVFGLMPHPERFVFAFQHPLRQSKDFGKYGWGKIIFQNAVDYVK